MLVIKQKVVKKIGSSLFVVFIVITLTFWIMHTVPGGPFDLDKALSASTKYNLEERFDLDKPLIIQYFLYLKNFIMGDFGISLKSGRDISMIISDSLKPSLIVGTISLSISTLLGLLFGILCAINNNKIIDKVLTVISNLFISIPNFILATLVLYFFCLKLKWFNVWNLENNYFLPILSLSLYPISKIMKLTKSSFLTNLSSDYIISLTAHGIPKYKIVLKHALRNSINPIIAYIGPLAVSIFTGDFAIETVFGIGGIGTVFINSINSRDYPVIMAITIIFCILLIFINLISDIIYILIDPRIRRDGDEFYEK